MLENVIAGIISGIISGVILLFPLLELIKKRLNKNEFIIFVDWTIVIKGNSTESRSGNIKNEKKLKSTIEKLIISPSDIDKLQIKMTSKIIKDNDDGKNWHESLNDISLRSRIFEDRIKEGLKIIFSKTFFEGYILQYKLSSIQEFAFDYVNYVISPKEILRDNKKTDYVVFFDGSVNAHWYFNFDDETVERFLAFGPDDFLMYTDKWDGSERTKIMMQTMMQFILGLQNRDEFFINKEKSEQKKIIEKIVYPIWWRIGLS
ncbi:MAG: hypothetical protein LBQ34_02450 [Alphaproteobacteria bacterium]|jgi:hypothetical protein|nr:hypothetical protein [Alphaproteobacteria bacterium]